MVAYDSAYPEVRTTAEVMIGVTRNQNGPQFQPSATYEKVIVDSYAVGEIILTLRATDGDSQVKTIQYHALSVLGYLQITQEYTCSILPMETAVDCIRERL